MWPVSHARKVALVAHWDWVLHNFRMPVARALRDRGMEVFFVCPPGGYRSALEGEGFRCVDWLVDRRGMNPVKERKAINALSEIYRTERPHVAHHFTIKPNLYGSIAARRSDVRVVINTFTGLGYLFSQRPLVSALRRALTPWMRRSLGGETVWTIVQNEEDRALLVRSGLVAADRLHLIPGSGVDVVRFHPADRSGAVPVRVLTAARLLRDKGIVEFVAAASLLHRHHPSIEFLVAGDPDLGNPRSLSTAQIRDWIEEGSAEFLGHREDMAELLRTVDIAVLATDYPEGLSRFLLEAAASGLPLIGTDVPGCRPVIREGVNGFLVPPRDDSALAGAIGRLASDGDMRRRFGLSSRALVEQRFSEEVTVREYMKLYELIGVT